MSDVGPVETTDDVGGRLLSGRPAVAFAIGIVVLEFAAAVATLVVTTLLPVVARDLVATDQLAILVSGSAVGLFTAMSVASSVLGRFGVRMTLTVGLVLTLAGGALAATAGSAWSFAGGRFVAGFAAGLLAVFGVSAAIKHLDERIRLRVIAASTAMWIVPGLVGPTATVGLEHLVGWRWTLLSPVPIALLGRLLVLRAAPTNNVSTPHRPIGRTLLIPIGVTLFVAFTEVRLWPLAVVALSLAVLGFGALMPQGTLRLRRGAPSALAGLTLFGVGYFGATSLVTIALTEGLGSSLAQAGWALGAAPVAWALVTLTIPRLQDRGVAPGPAAGLAVTTAGVAAMSVLLFAGVAYPPALVVWAVVGAGVGAAYPTLYLRATTPDGSVGANALASAVITTESFGGLVGSTVGGVVASAAAILDISNRAGFGLAFLGFAVALGLAVIAAARST